MLAAESENKLVGYISAQKGSLNRIAHTAYIVVDGTFLDEYYMAKIIE